MTKRERIESMLCDIEDDSNATIIINGIDFALKYVCYETRHDCLIIATINDCNIISTIYYDSINTFKIIEYRKGKSDMMISIDFDY